jgi:hypothetical protein
MAERERLPGRRDYEVLEFEHGLARLGWERMTPPKGTNLRNSWRLS